MKGNIDRSGHTEIHEFNDARGGDHHVLRFKVAMNDAVIGRSVNRTILLMRVVKRSTNHYSDGSADRRRKCAALRNDAIEPCTVDFFHFYEGEIVPFSDSMDLDDVGMFQFRADFIFRLEPLPDEVDRPRIDELYSAIHFKPRVPNFIHDGHPAPAKKLCNNTRAEGDFILSIRQSDEAWFV